jgi:hypothetical protein
MESLSEFGFRTRPRGMRDLLAKISITVLVATVKAKKIKEEYRTDHLCNSFFLYAHLLDFCVHNGN